MAGSRKTTTAAKKNTISPDENNPVPITSAVQAKSQQALVDENTELCNNHRWGSLRVVEKPICTRNLYMYKIVLSYLAAYYKKPTSEWELFFRHRNRPPWRATGGSSACISRLCLSRLEYWNPSTHQFLLFQISNLSTSLGGRLPFQDLLKNTTSNVIRLVSSHLFSYLHVSSLIFMSRLVSFILTWTLALILYTYTSWLSSKTLQTVT